LIKQKHSSVWGALSKLFLIVSLLVIYSCDQDNPITEVETEYLEVDVIGADYSLETIHSTYFGELTDKYYNTMTLDLFMNSPTLHNQIERLLIYDSVTGLGWEFYGDSLAHMFNEDLGAFRFQHLKFTNSNYSPRDRLFEVQLYGANNKTTKNEFELLIKDGFPRSIYTSNSWYDHDVLSIQLSSNLPAEWEANVQWNDNQSNLGSSVVEYQNTHELLINDVPEQATSFYLRFSYNLDGIARLLITEEEQIQDRLPSNLLLFEDEREVDQAVQLSYNDRIVLLDIESEEVSTIEFGVVGQLGARSLPSPPKLLRHSETDLAYIGLTNGNIYSYSTETFDLKLVHSFAGDLEDMLVVGAYLVANLDGGDYWTINLTTGEAVEYTSHTYYDARGMVFNPTKGVLYFLRTGVSPTDLHRFNFDINTGVLSNHSDSPYHSDYSMSTPLFIISQDELLLTRSGTMFSCNANVSNDLQYVGDIGMYLTDMNISPDLQNLMILRLDNDYYYNYGEHCSCLTIIDINNYELVTQQDIYGSPFRMFSKGDSVFILTHLDEIDRYGGVLLSYNELLNNPASLNIYYSQKMF
jgi:hypothetical protein